MRKVHQIGEMGTEQFASWLKDAKEALMKVYKEDEAEIIIDWFRLMKGRDEVELVGEGRVNAHLQFAYGIEGQPKPEFFTSVYQSMMSRMWIYAPYILKQAIEDGELS